MRKQDHYTVALKPMQNKGSHIHKPRFFAGESPVFDGLWGPWYSVAQTAKQPVERAMSGFNPFISSRGVGAPSSILAPSSDALVTSSDALVTSRCGNWKAGNC